MDELKAFFAQAMEADDNIQAVGKGEGGVTVVFVLDDQPEAMAAYATRAAGVLFVKCSEFIAYDYVNPKDRHRPAPGGVSIAHEDVTAGTLSGYVIDNLTGELCILGNNHVLANVDNASVGDAILQPGPADGGTKPNDVIGTFLRAVPIRAENISRFVDCALARPVNPADIEQQIIGIGYPGETIEPALGMWVKKYGRTTELTAGPIAIIEADVKVDYGGFARTIQRCFFTGCPGGGGDSGARYVHFGSNKSVGLLFAGGMVDGYATTIGCRMDLVEKYLNVTVPPPPVIQKRLALDVSKWQGEMNWQVAKDAGVDAAIIRAGSIDNVTGVPYEDFQFRRNAELAPALMPVGFYWYFRPNWNAITQANYFCDLIKDADWRIPPTCDIEEHASMSPAQVAAAVWSFVDRVQQITGKRPMIYTSPGFWDSYVARSAWAKDFPLWVANWVNVGVLYPLLPLDWRGVAGQPVMWQYRVARGLGSMYGAQSPDIDKDTTYPSFELLLDGEPPPPPDTVALMITIEGQGTVTPAGGQFPLNSTVQLTATPGDNWSFQGWGGDLEGDANPASLLMDGNKDVAAVFIEGESGPVVFEHYEGLTKVALNYRTGPGTGYAKLGSMPVGTRVEILEAALDAEGNAWVRIGYKQWAAQLYRGKEYIKYVV